ncbi:CDAN1 [Cordylochernes scorpioides]|uniref:CDAN1 n=1 Tax=Cordylochernes scorpioides TaxID=51811 RepID=A0ABY6KZT8_9ARAC|nr:CDAN1 [Cordylochernes scorpioides]
MILAITYELTEMRISKIYKNDTKTHFNKTYNNLSDNHINKSYYRNNSKNDKSLTFTLADYIDISVKNKKKTKNTRRITPTALISVPKVEDTAAFKSENAFLMPSQSEEGTNLNKERELLKQKREILSSSLSQNIEIINKTSVNIKMPLTPDFTKISNPAHLNRLSDIYSTLINMSMVPNILNEILFLFQLLTIKKYEENDDDTNIFSSIHNCIYFTLSTLQKLSVLPILLDGSACKNLLQIPFLSDYSPEFHQTLLKLYQKITFYKKFKLSSIQGVPFQVDTGNKENFSDEKSFHVFKKCRDLFYSIYRDWVQNHQKTGWLERSDFGRRVKQILEPSSDLSVILHIVRLFKTQLVTCGLASSEDDDTTDKLEKLNQRLVVPSKQDHHSSFVESEEFFYEFIKASDSNLLVSHLMLHLSADIMKMDRIEIFQSADSEVVEATRERFFSTVQSLRTMARVLGFLNFLPFQSASPLPGSLSKDLSWMRNKSEPPVKLMESLREALQNSRLIVTVPWVVEFLVMMDPAAPQLEIYQEMFDFLLRIYLKMESTASLTSFNRLYLQLCIGSLFENELFAQTIFFYHLPALMAQRSHIPEQREHKEEGLDGLQVVTPSLIHASFPSIRQLAPVLYAASRTEIRRLTPLTSNRVESSTAVSDLGGPANQKFLPCPLSLSQTDGGVCH